MGQLNYSKPYIETVRKPSEQCLVALKYIYEISTKENHDFYI